MKDRDWSSFLDNYPLNETIHITKSVIETISIIILSLNSFFEDKLEYPSVFPAEEGGLELTWSMESFFLNVEIVERNNLLNLYWFIKDIRSGDYFGEEFSLEEGIPPEIIKNFILRRLK